MIGVWLSLLWKEWREHQWKLAALTTLALGLVVLTKPDRVTQWLEYSGPMLWMAGAGGAVFVGIGVAAGENSRGTRSYIESQPLAMWRFACCKLLVGAVVAVLPGMIALGALALVARYGTLVWPELQGGFRLAFSSPLILPDVPLAGFAVTSVAIGLSFFLWTAALSVDLGPRPRSVIP